MSDDSNTIDPKFFNEVAQNAHMLGGAFYTIGLVYLFGTKYLLYYMIAGTIAAAIKEFWYDKNYENAATRGSDLNDFLHYMIGAAVGLIMIWIKS